MPPLELEERRLRDALHGLTGRDRWISSSWLYDELGSALFETITTLPRFYPAAAEREIISARAGTIAAHARSRTVVELGCGASAGMQPLLDALLAVGSLRRYAAIDLNESTLRRVGDRLADEYPSVECRGLIGDFTAGLPPALVGDGSRLVTFLGNSIGQFTQAERLAFLDQVSAMLGPDDFFLVSVDLVKDPAAAVGAYDDEAGVTAAFNRNGLTVLNRRLRADFQPRAFDNVAVWNEETERVETGLRSRRVQTVSIGALGARLHFAPGEMLRTHVSARFSHESFTDELHEAGLVADRWFTEPHNRFNLYLARADRSRRVG
jgi:L-histidine N-alpha-methyltransferase